VQIAAVQLQDSAQNTADFAIYNGIVCGPWLLLLFVLVYPSGRLFQRGGVRQQRGSWRSRLRSRRDTEGVVAGRDASFEEEE
jgi:hypothetical protein